MIRRTCMGWGMSICWLGSLQSSSTGVSCAPACCRRLKTFLLLMLLMLPLPQSPAPRWHQGGPEWRRAEAQSTRCSRRGWSPQRTECPTRGAWSSETYQWQCLTSALEWIQILCSVQLLHIESTCIYIVSELHTPILHIHVWFILYGVSYCAVYKLLKVFIGHV